MFVNFGLNIVMYIKGFVNLDILAKSAGMAETTGVKSAWSPSTPMMETTAYGNQQMINKPTMTAPSLATLMSFPRLLCGVVRS